MPSFYETDIAPHAGRFFSQVSADPRLSDAQRTRIQGTLLNGVEDITATRMKLQEEREQGKMRQLAYAKEYDALEEARWKRSRIQQQQARIGGLKEQAMGVLAADMDPETKHEALGSLAIENMDLLSENDGARTVMGYAASSIKRPVEKGFTKSQVINFIKDGAPPEVALRGDPEEIGNYLNAYTKEQTTLEEAKKMSAQQKAELAKMPLKYAKWVNPKTQTEEEDRWLDPESTQRAKVIVATLGTPEELKRFEALKSDDSDRKRKELVTDIQLRSLAGGEKKSSGYGARMGLR